MTASPDSPLDRTRRRRRAEYQARINRVVDHIGSHLTDELDLAALARIAGFSPYHFHRLFRALVGETLGHFIARLRLEKAASQLRGNPDKSVLEVALDCGYSSSTTFARAFRSHFALTPTEWRSAECNPGTPNRNPGTPNSNPSGDSVQLKTHIDPTTNQLQWRVTMNDSNHSPLAANVQVRTLPDLPVAYVRHVGPYAGDSALFQRLFGQLAAWAGPRGLLNPQAKMLCVYHDDPSVTDESKLRTDCGVSVPEGTEVDGAIGKATLRGGTYAVGHFEIASDQFSQAWQAVMGGWLPESGYQPADGPCFELYLNESEQHPEGKCVVEICVPVKPL